MSSCTSCGHQLGVGRFCTNCGAPVDSSTPDGTPVSTPVTDGDWRTDTAERRLSQAAADPRTPPAAVAPPPPPRYPLFADEVEGYTPYGPLVTTTSEPIAEPDAVAAAADEPRRAGLRAEYEPYEPYEYDEERRSPVLWILASALVLVLVTAGWWFLVRDDGCDPTADDGDGGQSSQDAGTDNEDGVDVAGRASAKAPKTATPNEDVNGDQVSYDASNMLDGVADTAWRAPGDGTGMKLTFTLREPTELHQVGLVNGYAKTSTDSKGRTFDWYLGNRRIQAVTWIFDDGSKVRQELDESRELQLVDVPDVVTGRVVLRLATVSAPGEGNAARDFTAISEVSFLGDPRPEQGRVGGISSGRLHDVDGNGSDMAFCPTCGAENSEPTTFCPSCGTRLAEPAPPPSGPPTSAPPPPTRVLPPSRARRSGPASGSSIGISIGIASWPATG